MKKFLGLLFVLLLSVNTYSQYSLNQVKAIWEPRYMPSRVNIDSTFNAIWALSGGGLSGTSTTIPYFNTSNTLSSTGIFKVGNAIEMGTNIYHSGLDTTKTRLLLTSTLFRLTSDAGVGAQGFITNTSSASSLGFNQHAIVASSTGLAVTSTSNGTFSCQVPAAFTTTVKIASFTTTAKNAIASPTAGMLVYDTTLGKLSVYTGIQWETITSAP